MNLLNLAANDPLAALQVVLGGPLHPGGEHATEDLLDRADVGADDRLVDLGCGAGGAVAQARKRGASAWGIDEAADGADVQARLETLPVADGSLTVVVSECALCLAGDLEQALGEAARVLEPGGRLAFSDVTVDRDLARVPPAIAEPLCLTGPRGSERILAAVREAGFTVEDHETHREELLAMRDRVYERVDVDGLLDALGERGDRLREARDDLEEALEAGDIGYLSVVARRRAPS